VGGSIRRIRFDATTFWKGPLLIRLRPAVDADAEACGRIIHAAFKDVDERHAFTPNFTSEQQATYVARLFIGLACMHGIVADDDGRVLGSVFLDVGDPIKSVGLISVDPASQRQGVGRRLMQAGLERVGDARGVRLIQEAFNTHAMGLYASLGFEVKEPLAVMTGRPRRAPSSGQTSRPITTVDLDECAALCRRVHGVDRTVDLQDALERFTPIAVVRAGRIVAYSYIIYGGSLAWGVAETHEDLEALLLVLGVSAPAPLRFNVPTRDTRLFRWCLDQGLRIDRPLTLMARGWYQEPRGPSFPSGFY
jgi:ribosomal protein S18 acetylase RimI-like enzyme